MLAYHYSNSQSQIGTILYTYLNLIYWFYIIPTIAIPVQFFNFTSSHTYLYYLFKVNTYCWWIIITEVIDVTFIFFELGNTNINIYSVPIEWKYFEFYKHFKTNQLL